MMNHTPGPWKDSSMLFSSGWRCIVNLPNGRSVDIADPRDRVTDEEDRQNAALIASAPNLEIERDHYKALLEKTEKVIGQALDVPEIWHDGLAEVRLEIQKELGGRR